MRLDIGTTNVPCAGTQVQLSNTCCMVLSIALKAHPANSGLLFFGISDVSSTEGWTLSPGESAPTLNFATSNPKEGGLKYSTFWVDTATNNNKAQRVVVLR